ncbi:retinol-binding protein pinta-like [Topomyia yanbarensis]|uniref:retinol-binding protein pinta-like n=1 Tax=Topomyia yanbarensis TaxID=2498891 RepID=UPI00273C165E|nr:retinol-binding protein pinta-like [Topomyia yanbarensis]XP_058833371.1 retinol-binding protein pinta-like [Topomyia yanbarensis]XP_058833372.1 retinol-binding protein pinta-like [Topomyia yanbarensis]XP_058833373.1 retinol-binding protein pinta-like [Topomyia yanbarensis]XP_058833374.1 retinol-binding protein pinta-like [Topomyia yanbarensis]
MPNIRPLNPDLARKAREELNEVPERIDNDLAALRTWLAKSPHIKARDDDQFLVTFLRGCKYSLERAKEKLDMFYTVRSALPELMKNRDPSDKDLAAILRTGCFVPFPQTETPDGPRLVLVRPGVGDPSMFSMQQVFKLQTMILDIMMKEDDNLCIAGQVGIADMSHTTMAHFLQFNPTLMKKISLLGQDASPLRMKGAHHIHTPPGFETIFNMFKGFMNAKNRSRLFVHGSNMEALFKEIPQRLFPEEYGGEAGSIQSIVDEWVKKVESYQDYFKEEEQYGTDETKRIGKPKNAESLFGFEGSFRKLEVD